MFLSTFHVTQDFFFSTLSVGAIAPPSFSFLFIGMLVRLIVSVTHLLEHLQYIFDPYSNFLLLHCRILTKLNVHKIHGK